MFESSLSNIWVWRILLNTLAKKKYEYFNEYSMHYLDREIFLTNHLEPIIHHNFRHLIENSISYAIYCKWTESFVQNKTLLQCLKLNGAQHQITSISLS